MAITEELVLEYEDAKAGFAAAKERFDKVENALCQEMLTTQTKSDLIDVRGVRKKVTVVAGETVSIDSDGLKAHMGALKFRKVCKPAKADGKLLEIAIRDGLISADEAAEFVTIKSSKPFVRVSTYVEGEG